MNGITEGDLQKLPREFQIMFAIFCAKQVIHLVKEQNSEVCNKAIEAAEGFLEGRVTSEECYVAANAAAAAYAAYAANAANAAYAAYTAAYTAANAANAANAYTAKQITEEQWSYYNELLTFEEEFEKILLGEV